MGTRYLTTRQTFGRFDDCDHRPVCARRNRQRGDAPPTGGGGRRTRRDRCCRQAGVGGDHRLCGVGEGRSGGRDLAREHLPGMWLRHPRSGVLLLVQLEAAGRTNFALPRRFPESRDSRARCSTPREGTTSWPDGQEGRRHRYRRLGGAVRARDRTRRGAATRVSADPVLGGAAARLPVSHGGAGPVPAVAGGAAGPSGNGRCDPANAEHADAPRADRTPAQPGGTALLKPRSTGELWR